MKIQSSQASSLFLAAGLFLVIPLTSGAAMGQFSNSLDRGDLAPDSFTTKGDPATDRNPSDRIVAGPVGVMLSSDSGRHRTPDHFTNTNVCSNRANVRLFGWIIEDIVNFSGAGVTADIHAERMIVGIVMGRGAQDPVMVIDRRCGFDCCTIVSG